MTNNAELGEFLSAKAKEILATKPSQEKPTFTLVLGIMTPKDYQWYLENMGDDVIHVNVEYTYSVINNQDFSNFLADDIHASMFLASFLAVGAIHEKKSIATGIANLEADELETMLAVMKSFGYKIHVQVLGTEDLSVIWQSLTEQQQWQVYTRDNCNRDLISYAYEDITNMPIQTFIEANKMGNVIVYNHNGELMGQSKPE